MTRRLEAKLDAAKTKTEVKMAAHMLMHAREKLKRLIESGS